MTDWLTPRPGEGDTLRLFDTEGDAAELARETAGIDANRTVTVRLSDLGGMSLGGYLSEGFGVPDDALMAHDDELREARGTVLAVPSSAVTGTIVPAGGLRPIVALPLSDTPAPAPSLATPDAEGMAAAPPIAAPGEGDLPRGGRGGMWWIALAVTALVLLLVFLAW